MAIELHSRFAVHPGEWLRAEIVEPAGLSVTALAERLHVGVEADRLMRMQAAHELAGRGRGRMRLWWRRLKSH